MGYTLYITRQNDWYDEDKSLQISLSEWEKYVAANAEMKAADTAEATSPENGIKISVKNKGAIQWIPGLPDGAKEIQAIFKYRDGNISIEIADEENLEALAAIAAQLSAKLQGEDGEMYEFTEDED